MASSVDRVKAALEAHGHGGELRRFPESTRTAEEAAAAIGCTVAQIAKSIVLRTGDRPVLVIASGVNRVDPAKVAELVGGPVKRADAGWVREVTGFAIGGVAPVGHLTQPIVLIDRSLESLEPIWAAAGSPNAVFSTGFADLVTLSGGQVADVKEG